MELYHSLYRNQPVHWGVDQNKNEEEMKVGDLVRGAYDKNKYRTGVILRIANAFGRDGEKVAEVLWDSTPVGLSQTGAAWVHDLEVLSEGR